MGILSDTLDGSIFKRKDKDLNSKDQISDIGSVNHIGGYSRRAMGLGTNGLDPTRVTEERMMDTVGMDTMYIPSQDQLRQLNGLRTQFGTSKNTIPGIGSRTFSTMGGSGLRIEVMSDESKRELIIKGLLSFGIDELTTHQAKKLGLSSRFLGVKVEPKVIKQPKRTLKL